MCFARFTFVFHALWMAAATMLVAGPFTPARNCPPLEEYEFVSDTDALVLVIQGETESIGKLDAAGNFVPNKNSLQLDRGQKLSGLSSDLINGAAQKGI